MSAAPGRLRAAPTRQVSARLTKSGASPSGSPHEYGETHAGVEQTRGQKLPLGPWSLRGSPSADGTTFGTRRHLLRASG